MSLSCIDPDVRNNSVVVKGLNRLTDNFVKLLTEEESSDVLREVTSNSVDSHLPEVSENTSIVEWWIKVESTKRYPVLCKIVLAALLWSQSGVNFQCNGRYYRSQIREDECGDL